VRQGYGRRLIGKVVVAPESITAAGSIKPPAFAANGDADHQAPMVPSRD
jgi:hypothetical protein